jgi:hypothetical protein
MPYEASGLRGSSRALSKKFKKKNLKRSKIKFYSFYFIFSRGTTLGSALAYVPLRQVYILIPYGASGLRGHA